MVYDWATAFKRGSITSKRTSSIVERLASDRAKFSARGI